MLIMGLATLESNMAIVGDWLRRLLKAGDDLHDICSPLSLFLSHILIPFPNQPKHDIQKFWWKEIWVDQSIWLLWEHPICRELPRQKQQALIQQQQEERLEKQLEKQKSRHWSTSVQLEDFQYQPQGYQVPFRQLRSSLFCRAKTPATANEESIIFWTLAFLPPARRSFSRDAPREGREGREGQGTVALRLDGAEKILTIFFWNVSKFHEFSHINI